ncbi:MAG: helix-hairpin-helix domain-containing protein, partial [Acutalibacteraceae bacterium]|nr:helix-hairpin-helix domain-containing protein [Acutalibacteraceae bacterium]
FTLVSTIQEEVHRFAIGYHRQVRKKNTLQTELTQIPGIGDNRAKAILSYFKTMKAVKQAEPEQLELVPGMTKPAAQAVYQYFRNQEE